MEGKNQKTSQAVRAIIPDNGGKLLFVKRAEDEETFPDHYELPGGKVEIGETPEYTVRREIDEETGLIIAPTLYKKIKGMNTEELDVYYFTAIVVGGELSDNAYWFAREEMDSIPIAFDKEMRSVIKEYFKGL